MDMVENATIVQAELVSKFKEVVREFSKTTGYHPSYNEINSSLIECLNHYNVKSILQESENKYSF